MGEPDRKPTNKVPGATTTTEALRKRKKGKKDNLELKCCTGTEMFHRSGTSGTAAADNLLSAARWQPGLKQAAAEVGVITL